MTNHDNMPSAIDTDRPFVEPTTQNSSFMKIVFVGLFCFVLIIFAWLVWIIFYEGVNSGSNSNKDVPVIKASTKPIKNRPDDPGGLVIRHRDKSVFRHLSSGDEYEPIERLLPAPEEPLPLEFNKNENNKTNDQSINSSHTPIEGLSKDMKNQSNQVWKVQLAALKNIKDAENAMSKILSLNKDILEELELKLKSVELPDGLYHRIQAGPLKSRSSAKALCDILKTRKQDCLIVAP